MNVKSLTRKLAEECAEHTKRSGILDASFKLIHMRKIKNLESQIIEHPGIIESIGHVTRLLGLDLPMARERGAYIIGELFKNNRLDDYASNKCLEKLLRLLTDEQKSMPDFVLRENVNALGKSGSPICESPLLDVLNQKRAKRIRMFVLVALGKVGRERSVERIFNFSKRYDLRYSDIMHAIWAFGKMAGTSRTNGPPLPRSTFKNVLELLVILLQSHTQPHMIHLFSMFAIGEICDQRQTSVFPDKIASHQLKRFQSILHSIITTLEQSKLKHRTQLIRMGNTVLRMMQGETLSHEQERILLTIRNLLVPNIKPLEGGDTTFRIEEMTQGYSIENIEFYNPKEKKPERNSVRDFFNK